MDKLSSEIAALQQYVSGLVAAKRESDGIKSKNYNGTINACSYEFPRHLSLLFLSLSPSSPLPSLLPLPPSLPPSPTQGVLQSEHQSSNTWISLHPSSEGNPGRISSAAFQRAAPSCLYQVPPPPATPTTTTTTTTSTSSCPTVVMEMTPRGPWLILRDLFLLRVASSPPALLLLWIMIKRSCL